MVGWANSSHISGTLLPGTFSGPEQENEPSVQKNHTFKKKDRATKLIKLTKKFFLLISGLFAVLLLILK